MRHRSSNSSQSRVEEVDVVGRPDHRSISTKSKKVWKTKHISRAVSFDAGPKWVRPLNATVHRPCPSSTQRTPILHQNLLSYTLTVLSAPQEGRTRCPPASSAYKHIDCCWICREGQREQNRVRERDRERERAAVDFVWRRLAVCSKRIGSTPLGRRCSNHTAGTSRACRLRGRSIPTGPKGTRTRDGVGQ